jgi:hypothetical protein
MAEKRLLYRGSSWQVGLECDRVHSLYVRIQCYWRKLSRKWFLVSFRFVAGLYL